MGVLSIPLFAHWLAKEKPTQDEVQIFEFEWIGVPSFPSCIFLPH
jgi:hypothetical protein